MPLPNCQICSQPLSEGEHTLNRRWHFDCEVCQICKDYFPNPGRIQECLDKSIAISHITCYQTAAIQDIRDNLIPVTQRMLDAANDQILTMRHTFKPPTSDIALLQGYLNVLVDAAKNVSWLLGTTKDKIRIDTLSDYAETEKKERKVRAEKSEIEQKVKIKSDERSLALAAERADETGLLRAKRKATEALAAAMPWLSPEQIAVMVSQANPKDIQ